MTAPPIPRETEVATARATAPGASAWVSANAGSGKTYVLARRVVRLLLGGTEPARILCLTFTKAAAAEMANRVFANLAEWTTAPDAKLDEAIANIEGERPSPERRAYARRLFANALETPGGLKIQTVHAFCEALLQRFPFEAGTPAHFTVIDDTAQAALVEAARSGMLAEAGLHPDGAVGRAFATLVAEATDGARDAALREIIEKRAEFQAWLAAGNGAQGAIALLAHQLGVRPDEDPEAAAREIASSPHFPPDYLRRLLDAIAGVGSTNDRKLADRIRAALEAGDGPEANLRWPEIFLTQGKPRKTLATGVITRLLPDLDARHTAECARLDAVLERWRAASTLRATEALAVLADDLVGRYEAAKAAGAKLDYDDLIARAGMLLAQKDASAWVHYKLDQGIDHVLVDEAQDTSPAQWEIVRTLTEEFFAGASARGMTRTVFAVGDEKQSIYSFQGAEPAWFGAMRARFRATAAAAGAQFEEVRLNLSFRSVPDVLSAVDAVFAPAAAHAGLAFDAEGPPVHEAYRRNEPGRVELWPVLEGEDPEEPEDWTAPVDHTPADSPAVRLAARIARTIRGWIDTGERLEGTGRRIRPGDVLILVRRRAGFADAMNRQLKQANIPAAGIDRLELTRHIAVMDLMALARAALLPDDDLTLAAVLRSPLFGLSEEELFSLGAGRGERRLYRALVDAARADGEGGRIAEAAQRLASFRAAAGRLDPHAFFAAALGEGGGRRRLRARFGAEADDVIDEFLGLALAYETEETPTLEGFLAFLEAGAREVVREVDTRRDEVRVMTVHGAKGLEAPVVFVIDDGAQPVHSVHEERIVTLGEPRDAATAAISAAPMGWAPDRARRPRAMDAAVAAARVAEEAEYRRLLYVALTRARDRLIVAGIRPRKGAARGLWHELVSNAWLDRSEQGDDDSGQPYWWWKGSGGAPKAPVEAEAVPPPAQLPNWFGQRATEHPRVAALVPSGLVDAEPDTVARRPFPPPRDALEAAVAGTSAALERGRLTHRLLEELPALPEAEREAAARRYVAARGGAFSDGEREALIAEVFAVLGDPAFGAVFAAGSRAEVPVSGSVRLAGGGEARLSGQIDRLAVTQDRVLLVDFKTDRPAPEGIEGVSDAYLAQLAGYRRLLSGVFPGRSIEAALLFTAAPRLIAIPDAVLATVEARLFAAA